MKRIFRALVTYQYLIFPCILVLVALAVIVRSYAPGTILSGWDTIHAEFNFPLYIRRILSVWQSHQGLGAAPSQAHLADLPRALVMWLISVIVPVTLSRYVYVLSMLIIGPLGIYFFLRKAVFQHTRFAPTFAFIGGFVYLLNIGIVQHFYVPLEMFVTFYGWLGWLFLSIIGYLKKPTKKSIVFFIAITIAIMPSAHTPTLWFVLFGGVVSFLAFMVLQSKRKLAALKYVAVVIAVMVVCNLFWLLPSLYYAKNYAQDVRLAKTNRIFSNEFFLRGQQRGTWSDLAQLTNFPFDWKVYDFKSQRFVDEMETWSSQVTIPFVNWWGYGIFAGALLGVLFAIKQKHKILIACIPILAICVFFLINANWPFTTVFLLLRNASETLKEAFRFPFTKFSLYLIFGYSVFFSFAAERIAHLLHRYIRFRTLYIGLFLMFLAGHAYYMLPAFTDGYIARYEKVHIPNDYFQLFEKMRSLPRGRVLELPLNSPYGWVYHSWGYQGAGFLWFGLDNPLMDREFDRWNWYNEQAYREFSYAVYSRNTDLFAKLLQKYNIAYILNDHTVVDPSAKKNDQVNFTREIADILNTLSGGSRLLSSSVLDLWNVSTGKSAAIAYSGLPTIGLPYRWTFTDQAFVDYGTYIGSTDPQVNYPFRTFLNEKDKLNNAVTINTDSYSYTAHLLRPRQEALGIIFPDYGRAERYVNADLFIRVVEEKAEVKLSFLLPTLLSVRESIFPVTLEEHDNAARLRFNDTVFQIPDPKLQTDWTYLGQVAVMTTESNTIGNHVFIPDISSEIGPITTTFDRIVGQVAKHKFNFTAYDIIPETVNGAGWQRKLVADGKTGAAQFTSRNAITGSAVNFPGLMHDMGYIVGVKSRNLSGLPLRVCVLNSYSDRCDVDDELTNSGEWHTDIFVLPAMKEGQGYSIRFTNISYSQQETKNQVSEIFVVPFPITYLQSIKVVEKPIPAQNAQPVGLDVKKTFTGYVLDQTLSSKTDTIVLYEAYEKGWHAYKVNKKSTLAQLFPALFGVEVKQHVTVNNWANGWNIGKQEQIDNERETIVFIYTPQYLAYAGLIVLGIGFVFVSVFGVGKRSIKKP